MTETATYMRDNHTFMTLDADPNVAIDQLENEVLNGFGGYGMLCPNKALGIELMHLGSREQWRNQRTEAHRWLRDFHNAVCAETCNAVGAC